MPLVATRASVAYGAGFGKVLAAAGGDTGAVFPITAFIVPSATTTISISSIPQTYTHLLLTTRERRSDSVFASTHLLVNGSTNTAHYDSIQMYGSNSTVSGGITTAGSLALLSTIGNLAATWAIIYDYTSTSKNKTFTSNTGSVASSDGYSIIRSGTYFGTTNAVTSLSFTIQAGANYAAGCSVSLWGIK